MISNENTIRLTAIDPAGQRRAVSYDISRSGTVADFKEQVTTRWAIPLTDREGRTQAWFARDQVLGRSLLDSEVLGDVYDEAQAEVEVEVSPEISAGI